MNRRSVCMNLYIYISISIGGSLARLCVLVYEPTQRTVYTRSIVMMGKPMRNIWRILVGVDQIVWEGRFDLFDRIDRRVGSWNPGSLRDPNGPFQRSFSIWSIGVTFWTVTEKLEFQSNCFGRSHFVRIRPTKVFICWWNPEPGDASIVHRQ